MGNHLWAGKPSRYVTSHPDQLSLPSLCATINNLSNTSCVKINWYKLKLYVYVYIYRTYTVSQKIGPLFTAYNFGNIEQIFTKFGTNQILYILNIVPEFI